MYKKLHFFINLRWEEFVEKNGSYFTELYKIVQLAYLHESNVYYCKEQLDDFVSNCEDLDMNFNSSFGNSLALILENAKRAPIKNTYIFEVQFENNGSYLKYVNDMVLCTVFQDDKVALLSLNGLEGSKTFLSIQSNTDFNRIRIEFIKDKDKVVEWLSNNGEIRNFHLSQKHGENGIGHWKGESPLLCNREEAQVLLNKSIADLKEKMRFFYFDEKHQTYIEFFFEGDNPQNQWHGFHIKQNDWAQRVPSNVRKYFNKY